MTRGNTILFFLLMFFFLDLNRVPLFFMIFFLEEVTVYKRKTKMKDSQTYLRTKALIPNDMNPINNCDDTQ